MKNYYQILEIPQSSSLNEIKAAFRRLSFRYHPDLNNDTDSEENFKKVNEAYQILSDPMLRQMFDAELRKKNIAYKYIPSDYMSKEIRKAKRTYRNVIYVFIFFITGFLVLAVSPSLSSVSYINEYKANLSRKANEYFLNSPERTKQIEIIVRHTNDLVNMFRKSH